MMKYTIVLSFSATNNEEEGSYILHEIHEGYEVRTKAATL